MHPDTELTPEQVGIWEDGFIAGRQDFGAIVISAMIELGRTSIRLNEFRDILHNLQTELPDHYLPEKIQELLTPLHKSHVRPEPSSEPQTKGK